MPKTSHLSREIQVALILGWSICFASAAELSLAQSDQLQPKDVVVTTKDGVQLKMTYYPSNAGQEAVPVIMLHDYNETRAAYAPLALALQNPREPNAASAPKIAPRAVLIVDLRGHGDSKSATAQDGTSLELDAHRFKTDAFQAMVALDMEAVRSFLVEQNDVGALNLNKLCVLGCGMGADVALIWAARDWATPPLPVRKQGQDVKALVLISPYWTFNGLTLVEATKFPPIQQQLSIFLAYGAADRTMAKDGENLRKIFAKHHPEPPADRVQELKDFFVVAPKTPLQGTKLLTNREFGLEPMIANFIEARLGSRSFPWLQRKKL